MLKYNIPKEEFRIMPYIKRKDTKNNKIENVYGWKIFSDCPSTFNNSSENSFLFKPKIDYHLPSFTYDLAKLWKEIKEYIKKQSLEQEDKIKEGPLPSPPAYEENSLQNSNNIFPINPYMDSSFSSK